MPFCVLLREQGFHALHLTLHAGSLSSSAYGLFCAIKLLLPRGTMPLALCQASTGIAAWSAWSLRSGTPAGAWPPGGVGPRLTLDTRQPLEQNPLSGG